METLRAHLSRAGALRRPDAIGWCIRLAKRIEQLHGLGVAHGNISLECILVSSTIPTARGTLVDLRRAPMNVAFHSPERARGGDISPADDAWAIALTLYTSLGGKNPFEGGRPDEVRARILSGPLAPLPAAAADPDLAAVLARALSPDPNGRFPKVSALREALEARMPPPRINFAPLDEEDDTDGAMDDEDDRIETAMFKPQLPAAQPGRPAARLPATPRPAAGMPPRPTSAAPPPMGRPTPANLRGPGAAPAPHLGPSRTTPVNPGFGAAPGQPEPHDREIDDDDENANTMIAKPNPAVAALRRQLRDQASAASAAKNAVPPAPGPPVGASPGPQPYVPQGAAPSGRRGPTERMDSMSAPDVPYRPPPAPPPAPPGPPLPQSRPSAAYGPNAVRTDVMNAVPEPSNRGGSLPSPDAWPQYNAGGGGQPAVPPARPSGPGASPPYSAPQPTRTPTPGGGSAGYSPYAPQPRDQGFPGAPHSSPYSQPQMAPQAPQPTNPGMMPGLQNGQRQNAATLALDSPNPFAEPPRTSPTTAMLIPGNPPVPSMPGPPAAISPFARPMTNELTSLPDQLDGRARQKKTVMIAGIVAVLVIAVVVVVGLAASSGGGSEPATPKTSTSPR